MEYYEGTSTVKRARLDYLASQFENMRMTEEESVTSFSSKLSSIANEAIVLGKNFKDKKTGQEADMMSSRKVCIL